MDYLAARLWFEAVRRSLGYKSANQLDLRFGRGKSKGSFKFYEKGQAFPSDKLVSKVEKAVPSSSGWLDLPLWEVLRNPHMQLHQVDSIVAQLPRVAERFTYRPPLAIEFLPRDWDHDKELERLRLEGDSIALAAALLLVQRYLIVGDPKRRAAAQEVAHSLLLRLGILWPWCLLPDKLFYVVNKRYFGDEVVAHLGIDFTYPPYKASSTQYQGRVRATRSLLGKLVSRQSLAPKPTTYIASASVLEEMSDKEKKVLTQAISEDGRLADAERSRVIGRFAAKVRKAAGKVVEDDLPGLATE